MQKLTEQETQKGLVVSYFGNSVAVEADNGQVFQCHLRRNQDLPVVGDRVLWQLQTEDSGIITQIEERRSLLARGHHHKIKLIAANIDTVVIVMAAPLPIFSEYLIDRYLAAAELLNIKSLLVLNKIDLLTETTQKELQERLKIYADIGYQVILSSVLLTDGLQALDQVLKGKTAVLVGPSGVGKSSIIAALSGNEMVRVGEVSTKGAGKHTTTATRLYHLSNGGSLIDSPGVREFNLWSVEKKDILSGFKEFGNFLQGCKFRDCQHIVEPGCAVQAAVQDGKISTQRFASYQKLIKETK